MGALILTLMMTWQQGAITTGDPCGLDESSAFYKACMAKLEEKKTGLPPIFMTADAYLRECESPKKPKWCERAVIVGEGSDQTLPTAPIDVPAVQESRTEEYGDSNWCNHCDNVSCTAMACDPHAKHTFEVTTCADKSRILEHDEHDPPKYWCRKVQQ